MVRVLVGDPRVGGIAEEAWPEGQAAFLDQVRAYVGCEDLDVVELDRLVGGCCDDLGWVDAEALMGDAEGYWTIGGGTRCHAGRFVISGPVADGIVSPARVDPATLGIEMYGARIVIDPEAPEHGRPGAITPVVRRTR